ncbi:olfactory receptor 18-like [Sorex fumeus]|uniref:olfactory receptor 18-like n=1 Tax=Sorex fumeus TaxID=62283 RepID=UPI0024ACA001|nr:olfactory receptor 18-like [Sorex fumeus]
MAPKRAEATPSGAPKKPRRVITLETKVKWIREHEGGATVSAIARRSSTCRSTVATVLKNKEKLLAAVRGSVSLQATRLTKVREGPISEMETRLLAWIEAHTQRHVPLSTLVITAKARALFAALKAEAGPGFDVQFTASSRWFRGFKNRYSLTRVQMPSEVPRAEEGGIQGCQDAVAEGSPPPAPEERQEVGAREEKDLKPLRKFTAQGLAEAFADLNGALEKFEAMDPNPERFAFVQRKVQDALFTYKLIHAEEKKRMKQVNGNLCLCSVDPHNLTGVVKFLFLGLSDDPQVQPVLFSLFLSMYLVTVTGNLLIILAVSSDPHLHTPMYSFLSVLSVADSGFISSTVPKMIWDIHTQSRSMSYTGCLAQLSSFNLFGCLDSVILAVMAYDRFVAICHPLHYPIIMNPQLCSLLALASFLISVLESQLNHLLMSQLTFCAVAKVPHFFCDLPQLIKISCNKSSAKDIMMFLIAAVFGALPASGILFSYSKIISSILRVPSSGGRHKAFSTCGSHLTVVCLFYGTGLGVYLSLAFSPSPRKNVVASVIYTVITPMLNPFIYTLRNRDIKRAFQRLFSNIVLQPSFSMSRGRNSPAESVATGLTTFPEGGCRHWQLASNFFT